MSRTLCEVAGCPEPATTTRPLKVTLRPVAGLTMRENELRLDVCNEHAETIDSEWARDGREEGAS